MKRHRRLGFLALAALMAGLLPAGQEKSILEQEKERMALNRKYDRHGIRAKKEFTVERSEAFLKIPKTESPTGDFVMAKTPPTVKLMILPDLDPEYFLDVNDPGDAYMFSWANWAYVVRSPDNRFYLSASNHRGFGCQINIYEYVPDRNLLHRVVDVTQLLGWTPQSYTDGKIHGKMGIMADGTLWAATHYGPHPDAQWFANGYRGSWLLSYNIFTREAKNWGIPLVGSNLDTFQLDEHRGRLVAVGSFSHMVLAYDVINKQARFAGYPPDGWKWGSRTMMLDKSTGKFWTVDYADDLAFFSYDPEFNSFEKFDVRPPISALDQKHGIPRGHTDRPAMDGWFYWATWNGLLFRFKPEGPQGPQVEPLTTTWDEGRDALQLPMDPTGRYIYYYPKENSPIVQYDVKTGQRKVIAWLQDFFLEKYGYLMGQVYGMEISEDGSYLVIGVNGAFEGPDKQFGHPGLLVVEIPESERLTEIK
jgi:hypothetical protein